MNEETVYNAPILMWILDSWLFS